MEPTISYPVTIFTSVAATFGKADTWGDARIYVLPSGERVRARYAEETGEVFFQYEDQDGHSEESMRIHSATLDSLSDPVTQSLQSFLEGNLSG